ncbi:MAG: hypothetical protein F4108_05170 [Acidimicrobiaceae bacterium]|nr:hypothetical protein [Acidimicrobiaceae bacterium]
MSPPRLRCRTRYSRLPRPRRLRHQLRRPRLRHPRRLRRWFGRFRLRSSRRNPRRHRSQPRGCRYRLLRRCPPRRPP